MDVEWFSCRGLCEELTWNQVNNVVGVLRSVNVVQRELHGCRMVGRWQRQFDIYCTRQQVALDVPLLHSDVAIICLALQTEALCMCTHELLLSSCTD